MSTNEKSDAEKKAELDSRIKGFNAELIGILGKYKLGLGATPVLVPAKDISLGFVIAAKPSIFDDSKSFESKQTEGESEAKEPGENAEGIVNPEE